MPLTDCENIFEIIRTLRIMTDCSKIFPKLLEHFELWVIVRKMFKMIPTDSSQKCLAVSFWQFGSWLFKNFRTVLRTVFFFTFLIRLGSKVRLWLMAAISKVFFTVSVMFLWNCLWSKCPNQLQTITDSLADDVLYFKFKRQHFYASHRYKISLVQLICE